MSFRKCTFYLCVCVLIGCVGSWVSPIGPSPLSEMNESPYPCVYLSCTLKTVVQDLVLPLSLILPVHLFRTWIVDICSSNSCVVFYMNHLCPGTLWHQGSAFKCVLLHDGGQIGGKTGPWFRRLVIVLIVILRNTISVNQPNPDPWFCCHLAPM